MHLLDAVAIAMNVRAGLYATGYPCTWTAGVVCSLRASPILICIHTSSRSRELHGQGISMSRQMILGCTNLSHSRSNWLNMLVGSIFSVGISTKLAQLGLHHLVLLPKMCKTLYFLHEEMQLQDMRICSVPKLIVPGPYSLASPVKFTLFPIWLFPDLILLHHQWSCTLDRVHNCAADHYYYKTHYLLLCNPFESGFQSPYKF